LTKHSSDSSTNYISFDETQCGRPMMNLSGYFVLNLVGLFLKCLPFIVKTWRKESSFSVLLCARRSFKFNFVVVTDFQVICPGLSFLA
jgi:hypothetical protein